MEANHQTFFCLLVFAHVCHLLMLRQDKLSVRGAVYFPNLTFEYTSLSVDFGCILNNLEATRYLTITNLSPMVVSYRWSFEVDSLVGQTAVFHTDPGSFSQLLEAGSDAFSATVDDTAREYLVSTFSV